jgi:hypothetical protein
LSVLVSKRPLVGNEFGPSTSGRGIAVSGASSVVSTVAYVMSLLSSERCPLKLVALMRPADRIAARCHFMRRPRNCKPLLEGSYRPVNWEFWPRPSHPSSLCENGNRRANCWTSAATKRGLSNLVFLFLQRRVSFSDRNHPTGRSEVFRHDLISQSNRLKRFLLCPGLEVREARFGRTISWRRSCPTRHQISMSGASKNRTCDLSIISAAL